LKTLRIGVLGFGTVGGGTVKLLLDNAELLQQRAGMPLQLVRIATKPIVPERERQLELDLAAAGVELTDDARRVIDDPEIDLVVELIGGYNPAKTFVLDALNSGKHVVTANKALIAEFGNEILAAASRAGREVGFEAAVAGAVPVLKAVRESLAANRIDRIYGILNGTCNYILTEMREKELPFHTVLKAAQGQGYAEADPSFDIDGIDTAHKLVILASLAFGVPLSFKDVAVEGIRNISALDIAWATRMGYRIKLLAIAKMSAEGLDMRVQPTMVPDDSMIAAVEGVFNTVLVHGDFSDTTMYYGRGAGERPTASAVVADIVDIARNVRAGCPRRVEALSVAPGQLAQTPIRPRATLSGKYYLRLMVEDRPGVLADTTAILRTHRISIEAIQQRVPSPEAAVALVMVTHTTTERQIQACIKDMAALPAVKDVPHIIRIEEFE
jgi:homoserine dehydrogenase